VQRYVERRLTVASEAGTPLVPSDADAEPPGVQFTPAAFRSVAARTRGIPRVVNTLCDRALEVGFERRARAIDEAVVEAAAEQLRLVTSSARSSVDAAPIPLAEADDLFGPARPPRRWIVYAGAGVFAFAVVLAGLSWFGRGSARVPPVRVTPPATAPVAPAPDAAVPRAETPPAASTLAAPTDPAPAAPTAAGTGGQIYIAVAAFRTADRAAMVAGQLTSAGLRAEARPSPAGTWQQVVVGPYLNMQEAAAAQQALTRQGFSGSRILRP